MNLRQLEAFRATIRCGSVTAAAREMNLSQPSVSRLLAGLEESAGFPLFARAGRGLEPTEEGLTFLEGVESMGGRHFRATVLRTSPSRVTALYGS